ncbi:MAG: AraC family transcriptional regulator, partial [Alphaproteobacteria bacterium]
REQLLAETRRYVENHLTAPIGVPDLAKAKNMERSRYSHYFRAVTGETPARFMTQVRLEAAARRLAETDATLDTIAAETGFADANHLCKVFRRHYHLSPGIYRKQLR